MFRINNIKHNNKIDIKSKSSSFMTSEITNKKEKDYSLIENLKKWATTNKKAHKQSPKWHSSKMPIKYYVPKNIDTRDTTESFSTWQRATAGITRFERINNPLNADIIIKFQKSPLPSMPNEVGHNNLELKGNYIQKATITIIEEPLFDKKLNSLQIKERIKRTLIHEIGHALGLKHSNSPKDIMFHQGINNKFLTKNDIKRITDLYTSERPDFVV